MNEVIALRGVVKRFGSTTALDRLDLTVDAGEVHAFLGPNGAGKTTTLRILLGLLRADSGSATVLGHDPWHDAVAIHRRLAYVPGDVSLWPGLSGGEVLELLGRLHGSVDPVRQAELVDLFDLDLRKRTRTYSKGNRQKVALIAALASDADIYLLDEPTSGLDPIMEAHFRSCVHDLRTQGRTILLSSHILSEAEALCDRVSIIRDGRTVESGTLAELRHLTRTSVTARVRRPPVELQEIPGVHDVTIVEGEVRAQVENGAMPAFVAALAQADVMELQSRPPTLEDLFLQHYVRT